MSDTWELKQLTAEDLATIEGLCQPYGAGGTVTLRRELAIALVNEVGVHRRRDLERRAVGEGVISIESIVSLRTGQPLVKITYGSVEAQLSADEAVDHAERIIEVAAGAHADAFLAWFLKTKIGVNPVGLGAILSDFRKFREQGIEAPGLEDEGEKS
jgi:hypothetical protein